MLLTNATGSFGFGVVVAMVIVGCVGMIIYRLIYQPMLDKQPFVALITSIGLFIAMEEVYRIIFGEYGLTFTQPPCKNQRSFGGSTLEIAISQQSFWPWS